MKKEGNFLFELIKLVCDVLTVNFAFLFTYWLRFNSGTFAVRYGIPSIQEYVKPLPIITVLLILVMRSFNLYAVKRRLSVLDELFLIVKAMTAATVILMAATFIYRDFSYSRLVLVLCWTDLIFFVFGERFVISRIRYFLRRKNKDFSNLLLIGAGQTSARIIRHIRNNPHWNYRIVGVVAVSEEPRQQNIEGVSLLGELDTLSNILSRFNIAEVILTTPSLPRDKVMLIILECEKRLITFRLIADMLGMITSQVDMENIDGIPLLGLKQSPLLLGPNIFIKRAMDIAGSLLALIIFSPLFAIIAVAVKLGSPGPVFYLQKRIGEDGRRFAIIKFRTMIDKAEKGLGAVWATKDDPRRTKVGLFLRRHNLDEIPQLINVLKGDMSLVGPRPERPHFVGKFKEDIPRYMARHRVKSGITGWAQVNGLRGDTSIEERTKYDLYYTENWSIIFDIKILLMSIFQTFFVSENAY